MAQDAQGIVTKVVEDDNERRLHIFLGYVTLRNKLLDCGQAVSDARGRTLEWVCELCKQQRREAKTPTTCYFATA